jgi:pimeloyl-ACP methyl ester carboxylesterase
MIRHQSSIFTLQFRRPEPGPVSPTTPNTYASAAGLGVRLVLMITTSSADGTEVRAVDEGQGPVILILHPGSDDGRSWGKVAALLARRFRVVRLHRRQYRLDIAGAPVTIGQEVDDVLAVVKVTGNPVVLVGHSSGGVVALEALVSSRSSFAGAVLYEPPVVIGPPLGGEALTQAKAALVT